MYQCFAYALRYPVLVYAGGRMPYFASLDKCGKKGTIFAKGQRQRAAERQKSRRGRHHALLTAIAELAMQTKQQKVELVKKLEDALKNSISTVLVHFKGVNIGEETQMRRELRAAGVKYVVAKKTLIKRALASLGHNTDEVPMEGELAIAHGGGEDATAAARLLHEYGKKFLTADKKNKLSIIGGLFEGKLVGETLMREIALIPSMQGLRGMFANVINSPRSRFAIVLSEVAKTKNA